MKYFFLLLIITIAKAKVNAQNYFKYHDEIIKAEELIFLDGRVNLGLAHFEQIFKDYDFVYIDDCIEAFQVALVYGKDEYAMAFIKKAMDNGFELNALNYLNQGCPCNFYNENEDSVFVFKNFLNKYYLILKDYEKAAFSKYISTLNIELINRLFKNHVIDELYKNYHPELNYIDPSEQSEVYKIVLNKNYNWIDSLLKNKIGIGDKNIGIYSKRLITELGVEDCDPKHLCNKYIRKYNIKGGKRTIPVVKYNDYFGASALFITYYHDGLKFYNLLNKNKEWLIGNGFLHPRELAYLHDSFANEATSNKIKMHLDPINFENCENKNEVNKLRSVFGLCTIELDIAKHRFSHKHHIKLYFGFFNATR